MVKKLEWAKPILVELGSARRMTFGQLETASITCKPGSGANTCVGGNGAVPV